MVPGARGWLARGAAIAAVVFGCAYLAASASATTQVLGKAGGLTYVRSQTSVGAASGTSATKATTAARCGKGRGKVTGGGLALAGSPADSFLNDSAPSDQIGDANVREWLGSAFHVAQPRRQLSVFGICSQSKGISIAVDLKFFDPAPDNQSAEVACDRGHVLGGGTLTNGSTSDAFIKATNPVDGADSNSIPDDSWIAYSHSLSGSGQDLLVYAVCRSGTAPAYRVADGHIALGHAGAATARCKGGSHVTGGGIYINGAPSDAHLVASRPFDSRDKGRVPDDGWTGKGFADAGGSKTITAYAVCIG